MNSSTVLIIAVLCLAIGYIAGLLISSLWANRTKAGDDADESETSEGSLTSDPIELLEVPVSTPEPDKNKQAPPFDQLRVWRDRPGGELQIDLDGKQYSKLDGLNLFQQERVAAWIPELQAWLKISTPNPVEPVKKEKTVTGPLSESKVSEIVLEVNSKPPQPPAPKSIVGQIDQILQDQIAGTSLSCRGIKLTEGPGEGVIVQIGLKHFQGIDTVDDPEVLAAIRHAVSTWEAQAG